MEGCLSVGQVSPSAGVEAAGIVVGVERRHLHLLHRLVLQRVVELAD